MNKSIIIVIMLIVCGCGSKLDSEEVIKERERMRSLNPHYYNPTTGKQETELNTLERLDTKAGVALRNLFRAGQDNETHDNQSK